MKNETRINFVQEDDVFTYSINTVYLLADRNCSKILKLSNTFTWYLNIPGTVVITCPMKKWDASVSKIWITKSEHLVSGFARVFDS